MSNNLPENDGELIEDVYENQDSNDQFDISAIGEAYANQKTYPSINPYTGQPDTSGITPVDDNTVANQNAVIDTADRTPQQYVVDTSQNAGTPGSPIVNPTIVEEAPLPRTRIVTYTSYYDMEITDYSPSALASLQAQGYKAIAVYDDGTEAEISWSEVRDLSPTAEYILTDIEEMTLANNQHFWTRTENPDGAGSGAFVTDDEQDAFLHSAQNNFADQGDASETVEQTETFTSDGLTTQYDLYYEAASTDYSVKVNGYNVNSGITKNTTNFVFDDAPDIDATVSVTYETQAKPWNNLLLNSYGLALRQGLTNLVTFTKSAVTFFDGEGNQNSNINAFFGRDGSRIGKETESHIQLDYHSLQLIDFEGNRYLHVSDLRDHDGKGPLFTDKTELSNNADATWVSYQTTYGIYVENDVPLVESVTVNGSVLQSSQYQVEYPTSTTFPNTVKILRSAIANLGLNADSAVVLLHIDVLVTYYTAGSLLKAFTFGNRVAGNFIGACSVSFGKDVTASGDYSHAEGKGSVASGTHSHAEGSGTTASGFNSHAEGERSEASGDASHAEGAQSKASGDISHAEGVICKASGYGSHAECYLTQASGDYSHAEGNRTIASNFGAHAEGDATTASGQYSHAEGMGTTASGYYSHAEGSGTIASGNYSHASGISTKATADGQFVIGKYNAEDANAVFIIGNGSSTDVNKRSNSFWINPGGQVNTKSRYEILSISHIDAAPSSDEWAGGLEWTNSTGGRAAILEYGSLTGAKTLRLTLSGTAGTSYQSGLIINKSYGNTYTGSMVYNGNDGRLTVPTQLLTQAIELQGMSSSANHGGFIDFHFNGSTADYTSRIIEVASGRVRITKKLELEKFTTGGYSYLNSKDPNNACITFVTQAVNNGSEYHSCLAGKLGTGGSWTIGHIDGSVFFGCFPPTYTTNAIPYNIVMQPGSAKLAFNGFSSYSVATPANFRSAIGAQAAGSYAAASHNHDGSNITSGVVPMARTYTYHATLTRTSGNSGSINMYVAGKSVYIMIASYHADTTGRLTIGTIPSGYRPPQEMYGVINGTPNGDYVLAQSNGNLQVQFNATTSWVYGFILYNVT